MVGWRRRDETGVKPTEIGVASTKPNHGEQKHEWQSRRINLVGEGYMFQGVGVRGLEDKEPLVARARFRRIRKAPNRHPRKKLSCARIGKKVPSR
jgi:hypothetical protein